MPSAGRPAPAIEPNKDGSVTIQYVPTQSGVHELNVSYNETPVEGQKQITVIKPLDDPAYFARSPVTEFWDLEELTRILLVMDRSTTGQ